MYASELAQFIQFYFIFDVRFFLLLWFQLECKITFLALWYTIGELLYVMLAWLSDRTIIFLCVSRICFFKDNKLSSQQFVHQQRHRRQVQWRKKIKWNKLIREADWGYYTSLGEISCAKSIPGNKCTRLRKRPSYLWIFMRIFFSSSVSSFFLPSLSFFLPSSSDTNLQESLTNGARNLLSQYLKLLIAGILVFFFRISQRYLIMRNWVCFRGGNEKYDGKMESMCYLFRGERI